MTEPDYWEAGRLELAALVEQLTPDAALNVLRQLAATPLDHDQVVPVLLAIVRDQVDQAQGKLATLTCEACGRLAGVLFNGECLDCIEKKATGQ